jgi:serine/threonine protein kinase
MSALAPNDGTATFRPLYVVGRGGMGSVEVALETREKGDEHVVALKRMLPNAVLDKRQVEMFLREAKLANLLVHPNVVRATSFGEIDGELLLVMEYIEGESLSSVVARAHERDGSLALPFIAHILAEICEGLHAAHELEDDAGRPLNVVHRDVSPHNVMVAYEGQIKLLDFGVAKIVAIAADGRTKTGEVKGKTAYMSPEQAMGDAIDRRSDLYSLGAVMFEAVSGKKMWGGGTDLDVIRRLALEEPPSLGDAAPGTPTVICELHRRLVARDPEERPATALDVARELRAFIATAGTRPEVRDVRALMTRLFATEIQQRRETLRKAIEANEANEENPAGAVLGTHLETPTAAADATPAPATRFAAPPTRSRWTRGVLLLASGVALAAVTGGVLWPKGETARAHVATSSAPASPATTATTVESNPSPASDSTPSAPSPALSLPVATQASTEPAPAASPTGKTGKARGAPGAPAVTGAPKVYESKPRPAAPMTKPSAPLDVDPTPF